MSATRFVSKDILEEIFGYRPFVHPSFVVIIDTLSAHNISIWYLIYNSIQQLIMKSAILAATIASAAGKLYYVYMISVREVLVIDW